MCRLMVNIKRRKKELWKPGDSLAHPSLTPITILGSSRENLDDDRLPSLFNYHPVHVAFLDVFTGWVRHGLAEKYAILTVLYAPPCLEFVYLL